MVAADLATLSSSQDIKLDHRSSDDSTNVLANQQISNADFERSFSR